MRDLEDEEILMTTMGCEVLHDIGQDQFPKAFFFQPFEMLRARLSAVYRNENLADAHQCRAVADRAMVPIS